MLCFLTCSFQYIEITQNQANPLIELFTVLGRNSTLLCVLGGESKIGGADYDLQVFESTH